MFEEMKTIKDKVTYLLETFPELRDNDYRLISNFIAYSVGKEKLITMSASDLLQLFSDGKLPHTESIRRVRAKIQEQDPTLRGLSYGNRKDKGNDMNKQIHNL
tara:strand:+ start:860 stop:1168 length:309 start_codon:yes stop_codon:yes gene_type:complete